MSSTKISNGWRSRLLVVTKMSRYGDSYVQSGYEAEISKSIPSGPKESPELINLRHIEETLAKQ